MKPYPVFTEATTDHQYPGLQNKVDPDQSGQVNGFFRWKSIADMREKFVMELHLIAPEELQRPIEILLESTANVTLRRLQRFLVKPRAEFQWTRSNEQTTGETGLITADENGNLMIPRLTISRMASRLTIEPLAR